MTARKDIGRSKGIGFWPLALGVAISGLAGLRLLSRLPSREVEADDIAPPVMGDSALARSVAQGIVDHPGMSGLYLLPDAHDAFAARMLLVGQAEHTLDLQYYIWHGDRTGTLLLEAVHQAAERGVKVRMLLDDNGISGLDTILAALDDHPNIEVRLFNPFRIRFPKAIGFVVDFQRLNRRMHNKSFTADTAVTIVGGRNIGDEYFGAGDGGLFADLDVMAVGSVVEQVERDFERYWRCASVWPAASILPRVSGERRRQLTRRASLVETDASARAFVDRLRQLPVVRQLLDGSLDLEWAPVRMISDDPAKGMGDAAPENLLAGKLELAVGAPQREFGIIAGYFVPGENSLDQLCVMARRGVSVSILTNGFGATDVGLVHAGYAPSRAALLKSGVRLFEMRNSVRHVPDRRTRRRGSRLGIGSSLRGSGTGSIAALRSNVSTLHAKTFTIDRERLFIGSFNLDPRSIELNTELGFVIESPGMANRVAEGFGDIIPAHAYQVELAENGALTWVERGQGAAVVHATEPDMRPIDRLGIAIAAKLPIRWML